MLRINNQIVPVDFIARHGNPHTVLGFEQASCKCGVDFVAVGSLEALVKSVGFKRHIVQAFQNYKAKHRQLIGGDVSG